MNDETSTVAAPVKPEVKQWQADSSNPPGPIQVNRFNKAQRNLNSEHNCCVERWGVIGGEEHEMGFLKLFGGRRREDVAKAQAEIGERYGWTVSKANVNQVIADMEATMPALAANRPVDDKRITKAQDEAQMIQSQTLEHDREKNRAMDRALFVATYGEPGIEVMPKDGYKPVYAVLTYDNSDITTDYFDSHATLGEPLLVGWCAGKAETEAAARAAISRYPSLSDAQHSWRWHTEKYSGGHGNYLQGAPVEIPDEIAALRGNKYDGGKITKGRWEIVFNHWLYRGKPMPVFKGYTDAQSCPADMPSGEGHGNTIGALGTVAYNSQHNGVEISFADKPSDSLRWSLKRAGFRITRRPPWKWYQKFSERAWAKACELAGVNAPLPAEQDGAGSYVQAQEDAYQDQQCAAIGA